ncbi:MAG: hypothetical protein ACR2J6_05060 [Thermoleophilaceae bacterium]
MTRTSDEARWFVIALIGGQGGAAIGLLLFGGMLFMPLVTALVGTGLAPLLVLATQWSRQRLVGRYLRAALRS